jgi:hypothetical protein
MYEVVVVVVVVVGIKVGGVSESGGRIKVVLV